MTATHKNDEVSTLGRLAKPPPYVRPLNSEFWLSTERAQLSIQRCRECDRWQYPAVTRCPNCGAADLVWSVVSGKGTVHTFTIFHTAFDPAFKQDLPYNVAIIALAEGPLMLSNMTGIENDAIQIGMPVEVTFENRDGAMVPQFRAE